MGGGGDGGVSGLEMASYVRVDKQEKEGRHIGRDRITKREENGLC